MLLPVTALSSGIMALLALLAFGSWPVSLVVACLSALLFLYLCELMR